MTDTSGGGAWAMNPSGDAEEALTELCRAVAAPVTIRPETSHGGTRPLGGPSVDAPATLDPEILQHIDALRESVAGMAALVTQRVRDLDDGAGERNRPAGDDESLADVLIRVGKNVLDRILRGRS